MACSVHLGGRMIWKGGILSPGRGTVNNTFALVAHTARWRAGPNAAARDAC
jgi:hypothetical protein